MSKLKALKKISKALYGEKGKKPNKALAKKRAANKKMRGGKVKK
jgi:hypothetical protein